MFLVCIAYDGKWLVVRRSDSLDEARELKKEYLADGNEAEILVRLKEGFYVVSDSGDSYQLSSAKGE